MGLKLGKPLVEGDPLDFLIKCKNGNIPPSEFQRVGPAMAIHFAYAQHERAEVERKKQHNAKLLAAKNEKEVLTGMQGMQVNDEAEVDKDLEEIKLRSAQRRLVSSSSPRRTRWRSI
jgi:hypothetical protein